MEQNEYTGNAAQHIGKHSADYMRVITFRLTEVVNTNGSRAKIVSMLNKIREELLNGTLKLN